MGVAFLGVASLDVFISYARSSEAVAELVNDGLTYAGFSVWRDDQLLPNQSFAEVIEHRLRTAKAVVVLWSEDGCKSQWVRAEADVARELGSLVQGAVDGCRLPLPFNQIQCVDLSGWDGDAEFAPWGRMLASVKALVSGGVEFRTSDSASVDLALPGKPSIAVLPFVGLNGDAGMDDFADGMVDEISLVLSRFSALFVIASGTTLSYRGQSYEPARISRELGVRYLLEGSVRSAGQSVRVTVKLTDGMTAKQVWSDRFSGTLDNIFDLQDQIAMSAAVRICSSIEQEEMTRAVSRPIRNPDCYQLYWRANALSRNWDPASMMAAIVLCDEMNAIEPDNALVAAMGGFCHAVCYSASWTNSSYDHHAEAMRGYQLAMRLGGDDPVILGYAAACLTLVAGDMKIADSLISRALEMNPGSASNLFWGGSVDLSIGQFERGIERFRLALRLNSKSLVRPFNLTMQGGCLFMLGRYDEAVALLSEALQHSPHYPPVQAYLAASLAQIGQLGAAQQAHSRLEALGGAGSVVATLTHPKHRQALLDALALASRSDNVIDLRSMRQG